MEKGKFNGEEQKMTNNTEMTEIQTEADKEINSSIFERPEKRELINKVKLIIKEYDPDLDIQTNLKILARALINKFDSQFQITNSTEELEKICEFLKLSKELCDLEPGGFKQTTRDNLNGLAAIFNNIQIKDGPIQCFSVASNALTEGGQLKKKDQYLKFDKIKESLDSIFTKYKLQHTYDIYLADIDYKYDLTEYSEQWEQNIQELSITTEVPVSRLSDLIPEYKQALSDFTQTKPGYFDKRESLFNEATLRQFKSTKERALFQMRLYTVMGKLIEKEISNGVLFDVQKQIYPYEQPFYNEARRKTPLPIIRVNKF